MLNVIDFPEREFCDRLHMTLPSQIVNRYLCGEVTGGAIPLNVASPVLPEAGDSGRFPPPRTAVAVTRAFESLREFWRGAAGLPAVLWAGPGKWLSGRGFARAHDGAPAVQETISTPLGTGPPLRADDPYRRSLLAAAHAPPEIAPLIPLTSMSSCC